MFSYSADFEPPAPCLDIAVVHPTNAAIEQSVFTQIDTGADISVIPYQVALALGLPRAGEILVEGYNGSQIPVIIYFARLRVGKFAFRRIRVVALERPIGLLGRDVLNLLITTLDGPQRQFDLVQLSESSHKV